MPPTVFDVGRILDEGRWRAYQAWLVVLTAIAIVFDGIDNQLLGIAVPTMAREWSVPRTAFAPVVSLGYIGMMIGGAGGGLVGDRVGRRTALLASMLVFGGMTAAAAASDGPVMLGWMRLLAGIGLGGAMPNAAALAAEFVPLRQRPVAVTITIICVPLGATLAGLIGIRALPVFGWRAIFVVGGLLPIAAAGLLALLLPESPRFLARRQGRWPELVRNLRRMGHEVPDGTAFDDKAERPVERASIGSLFVPEYRRDTLALCGAFFSCLLAVYIGFSWLTSLLTSAGFDPGTANAGITIFNLGGVVGSVAGAFAIRRFGSRQAMLCMAAGGIAGALGLGAMSIAHSSNVWQVFLMLALTGGFINATQTTMYALGAHVYPSAVRATGVGTAMGVGRLGAVVSGYAGAWALDLGGNAAFFRTIALAMLATFISLALIRRHVPRRTEP